MSKQKIILIHFALFIVMTLTLLLTSELILNYFAAGIHNVGMWISLMVFGTILILILNIVSCLVFLQQKTAIGIFIIIVNLFWIWFSLNLLYRYHFTEFNPTFYIANWILAMNLILAIIGILIGIRVITKKMNFKQALLTDFFIILIGLIIQQL